MRRNLLTVWMLSAWLAMSFALPAARGQDDSDKNKKTARPEVSAEDRSRAISFASEHHPELARLLEQLEKPRPGEFARAIRELNGQIQRLEKLREKTPAKYEEQLAA